MNQQDLTKLYAEQAAKLDSVNGAVRDLMAALEIDRRRRTWTKFTTPACSEYQFFKGPCFVQSIVAYSASLVQAYWMQAFDVSSAPPDVATGGTSPIALPPLSVPSQGTDSFDGPEDGIYFSQGLYLCASYNDLAKIKLTTNDFVFYALYRPA